MWFLVAIRVVWILQCPQLVPYAPEISCEEFFADRSAVLRRECLICSTEYRRGKAYNADYVSSRSICRTGKAANAYFPSIAISELRQEFGSEGCCAACAVSIECLASWHLNTISPLPCYG